jgi:hypothetical protein
MTGFSPRITRINTNKRKSQVTTIFLLICLQLLCVMDLSACMEKKERALPSKIRAAYWIIKPVEQAEDQLHLLKQYGFNAALVADVKYRLQENLWQGWENIARVHDIQLFPVFLFAVPQELKGQHLPYTNRYGTIYHATPCPLDGNYWNVVIGQRFEQMAHLSKSSAIAGIVFDSEMYGSDFSIYSDPCFCDSCWKKFIRATEPQATPNLSKEQRFEYLIQHHLFQRYSAFQSRQVQDILSQIERQIHNTNPHLLLGFLGYRDNWFYTGLIQGLGTTSRPVLVFSESTYVRGYTLYVTKEKRSIARAAEGIRKKSAVGSQQPAASRQQTESGSSEKRRQKAEEERKMKEDTPSIVRYLPGLWLGRFFPEELPSQLYTLARHTDGYWIYSADNLWGGGDQQPGNSALHGSTKEYWLALRKVNAELQQFSKDPDSFQSIIPTVLHLSSFYDTVQNRLVTQPTLEHFICDVFSAATQGSQVSRSLADSGRLTVPVLPNSNRLREPNSQNMPEEITYRGKILFHYFKDREGTITITHIPAGKYEDYTHYRFFDSNGMLFHEGFVDRHNRSITITLPANISGLISLLIDSGIDAARVSFSGLPFLIEASSTFPLTTMNTAHTYAFSVQPEKKRIKSRAYCSKDEFASITIQSPDEMICQKINVIEFTEIYIPIGSNFRNTQNFWTISVDAVPSRPFGELRFYLYDEEFPYLIPMYQ